VSGNGADESEMPFRTEKQPDLERILDAGGSATVDAGGGATADSELVTFVHALRATYRAEPGAETVARQMAEIRAASAALPTSRPQRDPKGRAAPVRRIALALAALAVSLPILATGLAFAGVSLPGAAGSAFERVGIELPNQGESAGEVGSAGADPRDGGTGPAGLADDPPSDGNGSELSQERRRGARGREASRYGRCLARAARDGAAHPNRRCEHLKKGSGGGKTAAPGRPDSPGKSATAPGQTGKQAQGKGKGKAKSNDKTKSKGNAQSNGKRSAGLGPG
jgi:hypothetical protein